MYNTKIYILYNLQLQNSKNNLRNPINLLTRRGLFYFTYKYCGLMLNNNVTESLKNNKV